MSAAGQETPLGELFAGPMNLVGTWSHLLLDAFAKSGVREVIVTPGSRSTPFVLAAVRHPELHCISLLDERVAASHAVGIAKASGRPALLICTSGTAPAHYLPAVMEASLSHVPLIVLTADRPAALQDCGAPQTVDQVKMFGDQVRWYADLGDPNWAEGSLRALRRKAAQAVFVSMHPLPGVVQVNARASKPLEPCAANDDERPAADRALRLRDQPLTHPHAPESALSDSVATHLAGLISSSPRGMIVCGPGPLSRIRERASILALARQTGFALMAETTSQARFGGERDGILAFDAFDAVLRSDRAIDELRPDVIVQVGPSPTSGAFERWLARQDARRIVIAPYGWQDPSSTAEELVVAPAGAAIERIAVHLRASAHDGPWRERVARWETHAWRAAESLLARQEQLSEAMCARLAVDAARAGLLGLGNSLPVRLVDTWCRGGSAPLAVFSQRGANGIDGMVSGFAGAASVHGGPAVLLLGDVTLAHDLSGLAAARRARCPLAVLAINNGGGRIFEQLPIAGLPGLGDDFGYWTTPPQVSFAKAAEAYGVGYARADSVPGLRTALARALETPGCTVVEAIVPPSGAIESSRMLWKAVGEAPSW